MTDLSVNFAGLELKNPLVVASCENVRDIRQIRKAEECGASAAIIKAIFPPGVVGLQRNLRIFADVKGRALHGIGATVRLSHDQGIELLKAAKKETKIKIGINIPFFKLEDRQLYADTAKRVADVGADFIEVNFSPQMPHHLGTLQKLEEWQADPEREISRIGEFLRDLPMWALEGTKTIKQAVNIPVIVKLAPEGVDVIAMAKAMESGGADAIDAINSMGGAFLVDIFQGGRPKIPAARTSLLRVSGAPMKPYAQGIVARLSKAVKIPIMGTGGLMNWSDVVEMIMFGATTVSFCALLMISGFEAITKIERRLKQFMEQQGYNHIDDFKGLALKYVAPSQPACEVIPSVARIDEEKCTLCGLCLRPAHCVAISMEDERVVINEAECLGCGTCFLLCPTDVISMVEI